MSALITRGRNRKSPKVEIVSMIDVMFFLVVFFMVFSTFKVSSDGIPVELPRAATAQDQPASEIVVSITKDGVFYLDDRLTTIQGLKDGVRQVLAQRPDVVAVIRADREARFEWVVTAIDAMTEAGGSSLSFTVEKPPTI